MVFFVYDTLSFPTIDAIDAVDIHSWKFRSTMMMRRVSWNRSPYFALFSGSLPVCRSFSSSCGRSAYARYEPPEFYGLPPGSTCAGSFAQKIAESHLHRRHYKLWKHLFTARKAFTNQNKCDRNTFILPISKNLLKNSSFKDNISSSVNLWWRKSREDKNNPDREY